MPTITEDIAIKAFEAAKAFPEDEEVQRRATGIRDAYRKQQEGLGKPLFENMARQQAERQRATRRVFQDRETHGLDGETLDKLNAQLRDRPEEKFEVFNERFFSESYGMPMEQARTMRRDLIGEYSEKTWGERVDSDEAFYQKLGEQFDTDDQIAGLAQTAALQGIPAVQAWAQVPDEIKTNPSFQRRQKALLAEFEETAAATDARISPYRQVVTQTIEDLRESMGAGQGDGGGMGPLESWREVGREASGAMDFRDFAQRIVEIPKEDRDLVIAAIIAGAGEGDAKGPSQKLAENFARGVQSIAADTVGAIDRNALRQLQSFANQGAGVDGDATTVQGYLQGLNARIAAAGDPTGAAALAAGMSDKTAPSEEIRKEAAALIETQMEAIDVASDLQQIADGVIDPAKGEYMVTRGLYAAARSIPYTLVAMMPGGIALNTVALTEQSYQTMRRANPDMSRDEAMAISAISGPIQAGLEQIPAAMLTGKLPTLGRFMNQAVATRGGAAARFGVRTAEGVAIEMVQENLQDLTPFAVQGTIAALSDDMPDVPWGDVYGGDFWNQQGELFFATLPLALIGAGAGTVRDFTAARSLMHDPRAVSSIIGNEAKASEIAEAAQSGDYDKAQSLLREGMREVKADRSDLMAVRQKAAAELQADAARKAATITRAEEVGVLPAIGRTAEGWSLKFNDGTARTFENHQEADAARWRYTEEAGLSVAEATRSVIQSVESQLEAGREVAFTFVPERRTLLNAVNEGEVSRDAANRRGQIAEDVGGQAPAPQEESEIDPEQEYQEAFTAAELAAITEDDKLALFQILGSNKTEFADGVQRTTIKLFQGATPLTVIEEKLEGDASAMIASGKRDWLLYSLIRYQRTSGDKVFREGVKSNEDISDADLKEAWSHLGQSYFVGRSRRGDVGDRWKSRNFRKAAAELLRSPVGAAMDGYARFFQSVWKRAAKLNKLRREGKLDADLERELARSVGFGEQAEYEASVETEAAALLREMEESEMTREPLEASTFEPTDDAPFSVMQYRIDHQPHPENSQLHDLTEMFGDDIYGPNALRYFGAGQDGEREVVEVFKRAKGNPDAPVTIYRVVPDFVNEINPGDWVTVSKAAAKGMNFPEFIGTDRKGNPQKPKIISKKVKASEVRWPGDSLLEQGYFPESGDIEAQPMTDDAPFSVVNTGGMRQNRAINSDSSASGEGSVSGSQADYIAGNIYVKNGLVTNATGEPINFFHGNSSGEFDKFDASLLGSNTGADSAKEAFFGTDSVDVASFYTATDELAEESGFDGFTGAVDVIRDLEFQIEEHAESMGLEPEEYADDWFIKDLLKKIEEEKDWIQDGLRTFRESGHVKRFNLQSRNPKVLDWGGKSTSQKPLGDAIRDAKKAGHDAVIFENVIDPMFPSTVIAFFNPDQATTSNDQSASEQSDASFSVITNAESRIAESFNPFLRNPEQRRRIVLEAQKRSAEAARGFQEIIRFNRSGADIERERKTREGELMGEKLDTLSPSEIGALEAMGTLDDIGMRPILSDLVREKYYKTKSGKSVKYWTGSLMSKSAAERAGMDTKGGEWDGIPEGLPPYVWGGTITPDRAANQFGFDSPDEFWTALSAEIASFQNLKADTKAAMTRIRELEREAKAESRVWAEEQKRLRKTVGTDRATLIAAMRTLDAMISALPSEIRGKVGGFVRLAQFKTPGAMLDELVRRSIALDRALEKWLKDEATKEAKDFFATVKKKVKTEAGKKAQADALPEMVVVMKAAEEAFKSMSAEQGQARGAEITGLLLSGKVPDANVAAMQMMAELIPLFSGWNGRTEQQVINGKDVRVRVAEASGTAQKFAAIEAAKKYWTEGILEYKRQAAETKERRDRMREGGMEDVAKANKLLTRDEQRGIEQTRKSLPKKFALNIMSFDGFFRWHLGDDSKLYQWLTDSERKAANTYDDAVRNITRAVDSWFTEKAGSRFKGEKLRERLAESKTKITPEVGEVRTMSQLEMITAKLIWRQEDGKRHMKGRRDENGNVVSTWSYGEDFMAQIDEALTDEARALMGFLSDAYDAEYEPLNKVYRKLFGIDLPKHILYSPLTVKPMIKGDAGVDSITGFFSGGLSGIAGALKTRGSSIVEPDFKDALQTYVSHSMQMEHFKAFAELSREARAILGRVEFRDQIQRASGEEGVAVLDGLLEILDKGGIRSSHVYLEATRTLDKLTGRLSTMILFGKLQTVALNVTQLAAASSEMGVATYWKQFGKLWFSPTNWVEALRTPYIQRRIDEMPPVVRQVLESNRKLAPSRLSDMNDKLGYGISASDGFFTAASYAMVYDWKQGQGREMGMDGDLLETWSRNETERIMDRIAQPTRKGARSIFENTLGPEGRAFFNFFSEARKNVALASYATQKDPSKLAGVAQFVFLNAAMSSVIRAAWADLRDDDEEADEIYWNPGKIVLEIAIDPLYGIPVVGGMLQDAIKAAFGFKVFGGSIFESGQNAIPATRRVLTNDYDGVEIDRRAADFNAILAAFGYFSRDAAALTSITNVVEDALKVYDNLVD